jgi:predicted site-specific integrase-resolvase
MSKEETEGQPEMIYNSTEAARYLNVARPTIMRYFWLGKLKAAMLNASGTPYFTSSALDEIRPEIERNKKAFIEPRERNREAKDE